MDLGTTIVGIIITLVCIIPFMIMHRKAGQRDRQLLQTLFGFAEKGGFKVSQHAHWSQSAIGMDEADNTVFFVKKTPGNETTQQVKLAEIQKCRVVNVSKAESNNGNFKFVDRLELVFTYHDKSQAESVFEFYHADFDGLTLTGELQLAEKWCRLFNDRITASIRKK